jgi:hypothetical protein
MAAGTFGVKGPVEHLTERLTVQVDGKPKRKMGRV